MNRTFEDKPAAMEPVPLLIGLYGPSGSGKTFSALRLATGIQRVKGKEIFLIDTEAKRALHYSSRFKFRHVEFRAPFSPMDYLAAVDHCVKKGAGVIIIDSCSHEWEGAGGVLEMHEAEIDRLAEKDGGKNAPSWKRESLNFPAWARPKQEHQRLINSLLQIDCSFILCFRSKEKVKLLSKAERDAAKDRGERVDPVKPLGFMPIGDTSFIYEMTVSCLLYPAARGEPTWNSEESGEKLMTKLPEQFRKLFGQPGALSEDLGEAMARWASGDEPRVAGVDVDGIVARYEACSEPAERDRLRAEVETVWRRLKKPDQQRLTAAATAANERIDAAAAAAASASQGEALL